MNAQIDGVDVQVAQPPGFSYSLMDRLDPARTRGNSSTTISIAATNAACSVLGSEAMTERDKGEHEIRIGEEGATYWMSKVKVEQWTRDVIECSAVGGNASWMEDARVTRLREVPMGTSDNIDAEYQRRTWEDESLPIHFPLIDYGFLEGRAAGFNVTAIQLRPACRLWRFMERGFAMRGWNITAKGRFAALAPKLIMPNVADNIEADQQTKDGYSALVTGTEQVFQTVTAAGQESFMLDFNAVVSDPAGAFNLGTDRYTAPVRMNVQPVIGARIRVTTPGSQVPGLFIYVRSNIAPQVASIVQILPTSFNDGVAVYNLVDFTAPVANIGATQQAWITLEAFGTGGSLGAEITVDNLRVRWQPAFIPYQVGITIDINTIAPDWTLAECITNISALLNVKFVTNDITGEVEAWHYDDLLKPTSEGIDWQGRETHDPAPAKARPDHPSRYLFRFETDDKDRDLEFVNNELGFPGLGNVDVDSGGYLDALEVGVAWAPTAMGTGLEGRVYIPIMRKVDGPYQINYLDYTERILIADYRSPALWTHDGDALTQQPKVYFVWPGEQRWSLSFGNEFWYGTTAPGTVDAYHATFLRRAGDAYTLTISLRLWDDELMGLDLTRPVRVSDGFTSGWYYILRIDQKIFGDEGYTSVELIQV